MVFRVRVMLPVLSWRREHDVDWIQDQQLVKMQTPYEEWETASHARRKLIADLFRPAPNVLRSATSFSTNCPLEDSESRGWRLTINSVRSWSATSPTSPPTIEVSILEGIVALRSWRHLRENDAGRELERRYRGTADLTPADEMSLILAEREFASIFHSIGSALDRLMICVATIAGLPVELRRLSWNAGLRQARSSVSDGGVPRRSSIRLEFPAWRRTSGLRSGWTGRLV